jgi:hypothetical protein
VDGALGEPRVPGLGGGSAEGTAAIAALEGRFEEAEKLARQALRELDRSPDLGVAKSIRETLVRVTARPPGGEARA